MEVYKTGGLDPRQFAPADINFDGKYIPEADRNTLHNLGEATGTLPYSKLPPELILQLQDILSRISGQSTGVPVYSAGINFTGTGVVGSTHTLTFGTATNTPTATGYTLLMNGVAVGSEVVVPYATTTATFTPSSSDAGKIASYSVRFQNASGWSVPKVSPEITIGSVATSSWSRVATSAVITSESIQAIACLPDASAVYCAQRVITGGGGSGVTAANVVGTSTSNPAATTTPTLNVPTAAQGTTVTATAPLLLLGIWVEDDAASDTSSVFTKPDSSWQMIDPIEINGPDGQRVFIGLREYAVSETVPTTIAASNTFNKKFNSACVAIKDHNPGLVTAGNTLEFFKTLVSTTASTAPSIAITPTNATAYDNDLAIFVMTPDAVGSSQVSAFTAPSIGSGSFANFTNVLDDHSSGTGQAIPVHVSTAVKTTAGSLGTMTGSVTMTSGTAVPLGAVLVIRGKQSGGGGQLAAAAKIGRFTYSAGAFAAQSTVLTLAAADSWINGIAATNLSSGPYLAWSGAAPQDLGPGYTQGYAYDSAVSMWIDGIRFEGNFNSSSPSLGASVAANGSLSISADGSVMNAVFPSPTNQFYCFDGSDTGTLRLSPTINAPASTTLTAPSPGNSNSTDTAGLTRAVVSNGRILFETRANKFGVWSAHSTLTPNGGPLATKVCMSRNKTRLMVQVGINVEFWSGGLGSWTLQNKLTAAGGYNNFGNAMCISDDGTKGFISEDNGTNVTGSLAAGYTQKQWRLVRVEMG